MMTGRRLSQEDIESRAFRFFRQTGVEGQVTSCGATFLTSSEAKGGDLGSVIRFSDHRRRNSEDRRRIGFLRGIIPEGLAEATTAFAAEMARPFHPPPYSQKPLRIEMNPARMCSHWLTELLARQPKDRCALS